MTAAVVSIVLLLVGLPLLAFWIGGRSGWSRLRPGRGPDPWGGVVRAHGLSAGEADPIGDGVPEADALEQQLAAAPGAAGSPRSVGDVDANEADVLEQEADVPYDEDDRGL